MKTAKIITKVLLLALLIINISACNTNKKTTATTQPSQEQGRQKGDPFEKLNLTGEQKENFKAIKDKYRKEIRTARESAGGDRSTVRSVIDGIRERENKEVKSILTEKQYAIYLEILQERRQNGPRGGNRPPRGGGK